MHAKRLSWLRGRLRWPGILLGLPLLFAAAARAAPPVYVVEAGPAVPAVTAPAPPLVLDLQGCRALALQRHPALAAYRASLGAAHQKQASLANLRFASLLRRDLPVRLSQAEKGVMAAQAQLSQAEWDVLYGVTRMYFTALYAQEQQKIAREALDPKNERGIRRLKELLLDPEKKDQLREDLRRDIKSWDAEQLDVIIEGAEARSVEARVGYERALAALREAMGLEHDCAVVLPATAGLPVITLPVDRQHIVALAQGRRGELVQAAVGLEVTHLEVVAQGRVLGLSAQTFAAGSDLHAQPVPLGVANGDYRPGAIGLEMPTTMVGKRHDRQAQAHALHERADAVVGKTRHLITLQAEDAYLKWLQATEELEKFEKASRTADRVGQAIAGAFNPALRPPAPTLRIDRPDRPTLAEVLDGNVRAITLRLRVNQARYDLLLALTSLERVTAGGFCPGFDQPLPIPSPKEGDGKDSDKDDKKPREG